MIVVRLARGLARNCSAEHRWRKVSVRATAFLFTLVLLLSAGLLARVDRQGDRIAGRGAVVAEVTRATDLFVAIGNDYWADQRIDLVWLDPVDPAAQEHPLPPGVRALPPPGQAVVSPELARLIAAAPDLAQRYRVSGVLETRGLATGAELVAYLRPPPGRELTQATAGTRVSRFGSSATSDSVPLFQNAEPLRFRDLAYGALGFLLIPGLIMMLVGLSTASAQRDRRFDLLHALGAPAGSRRALAAAEALVLAVPAVLLACVAWWPIGAFPSRLPLVGSALVPGDVALSLGWVIVAAAAACVMIILLAVLLQQGRDLVGRVRPRAVARRPSRWRWATAALAVAAFWVATVTREAPNDVGASFNWVGSLLVVVASALIVPVMARGVGLVLGTVSPIAISLAGRLLAGESTRLSRPLLPVAALVPIAFVTLGYVALQGQIEEPPGILKGTHAFVVTWPQKSPGDLDQLSRRLPDGARAFPVQLAAEPGQTTTVGARCDDLVGLLPGLTCDGPDYALPPENGRQLAGVIGAFDPVVLGPLLNSSGSVVVLGSGSFAALDRQVRTAALASLGYATVETRLAGVKLTSPLVPWIIAGTNATLLVLSVAGLLALVDRAVSGRAGRRVLLNLGMSREHYTAVAGWVFGGPYLVVAVVTSAAGFAVLVNMIRPASSGIAVPVGGITLILGCLILAGIAALLLVRSLSRQDVLRARE